MQDDRDEDGWDDGESWGDSRESWGDEEDWDDDDNLSAEEQADGEELHIPSDIPLITHTVTFKCIGATKDNYAQEALQKVNSYKRNFTCTFIHVKFCIH